MLSPGDPTPDFILPDDADNAVSLDDLLRTGPLVLYFYPADFTPVCTAEACTFRDMHPQLAAAGLTLAGVSPQSQQSHDKFKAKHKLPFTLLADCDKRVIKQYDANGPFGFGTRRVTYLIGQDKTILDAVRSDLGTAKHKAFVQRAIDSAKSSEPGA